MEELIKNSIQESLNSLQAFASSESNLKRMENAAVLISQAIKNGNKVISCGNGGSLCDAMHFAEELTGRYRNDRNPLPAMSINDPAHITCVGNDYSFTQIYSRYIDAIGKKGDVLVAISTSGHSENILWALEAAKNRGMAVIALTCDSDNPLRQKADVAICAPKTKYSDRIQEIHIKVIHIIIQLIESKLV